MGAILSGLFRHALTIFGGAAVTSGYITKESVDALATTPELFGGNGAEILGGVSILLGVGASVLEKYKQKRKAL